jgi:hypothetical protein
MRGGTAGMWRFRVKLRTGAGSELSLRARCHMVHGEFIWIFHSEVKAFKCFSWICSLPSSVELTGQTEEGKEKHR